MYTGKASRASDKQIAIWLFLVAALVFVMIIVGGLTRLTDSGLSITEWRPVTGVIPPLSESAWAEEFALYQQTAEFQIQNYAMTMAEFKVIYWWEWGHRFLGRLIGAAFAIPLLVFALARRLRPWLTPRLLVLLALGGLQGFIGWWMVASGLTDRLDVSHYRLAVHLGLAFILFGALIWTGLDAWNGERAALRWSPIAIFAGLFAAFTFVQVILGAFVAGLDAGRIYTDWPLMNGGFLPPAYAEGDVSWATALEDRGAVQFHHRLGGYLLALMAIVFVATAWRQAADARGFLVAVGGLTAAQVVLGVATLMQAAPLALSASHQALAAILLGVAVAAARRLALTDPSSNRTQTASLSPPTAAQATQR